jgi:hypothetical protein
MSADNPQGKGDLRSKVGMSTLDLLGGTASVNRVVRIMLHKSRMTYQELMDAVDKLPPEKRMSRGDLDAALADLIARDWLESREEDGQAVYQVVLRSKQSSSELLHSDDLPKIEVAVAREVNPHLDQAAQKKGGLMGALKGLFGGRK